MIAKWKPFSTTGWFNLDGNKLVARRIGLISATDQTEGEKHGRLAPYTPYPNFAPARALLSMGTNWGLHPKRTIEKVGLI